MTIISKFFNPWVLIVCLLTITFAYITGKSEGDTNGFNRAQNNNLQAQQKAVARAIEQTNLMNDQNAKISEAYWQDQQQSKPKIKTIEKRIIKYVETSKPGLCDLDDGELLILSDLTDIVNGEPKSTD